MRSFSMSNRERLAHGALGFTVIFFTVIFWFFALASFVYSESSNSSIAKLYSSQGNVQNQKPSDRLWTDIELGFSFFPDYVVRTGAKSRAAIRFYDGYLLRLGQNTKMQIKPSGNQESKDVSFFEGLGYFFSRKPRNFPVIQTPQVSAAVRGTEFTIRVTEDLTEISILEGRVEATNVYGSVNATRGEVIVARNGQAPTKQILVSPSDAVQWALYYPAVLDFSDYADFTPGASTTEKLAWEALAAGSLDVTATGLASTGWRSAMLRSMAAYLQGDLQRAFAELNGTQSSSSGFYLYRSALALAIGDVEEAMGYLAQSEVLLDQVSKENRAPLRSACYAQLSIVALTKNEKAEALRLAKEAVIQSPDSVSAALAMSYAEQAHFRLHETKTWLNTAIANNSSASFPHARLAELYLGFDEVERARAEVSEALALLPDNAYALAVKGFIELSRYNVQAAKKAFSRSLTQDSSQALAHLGMGLAIVRGGDLESGREHIEKAVHLSPNVSLYRSYLGKAFFEEEKEDLSAMEYHRAIELDPNDPTPYLYRSYLNISRHRPIEALWDIEDSLARNDNRAVFRSKLLLDKDHAVRSTGLARVFSRLGFSEVARYEAIKALNKDYSNYSAHFLLADGFASLNNQGQAEVTETLIGRLLVPVTFSGIRPGTGVSASLNEYTSLFERPVNRIQVNADGATKEERFLGSVRTQGTTDRVGYDFEYTGLTQEEESDRDGEFVLDDTDSLHRVLSAGQVRVSEDWTTIWDGGFVTSDGDTLSSDPDLGGSSTTLDSRSEIYNFRLGSHYKTGPTSGFLTQASYFDTRLDSRLLAEIPPIGLEANQDSRAFQTDIMQYWHSQFFGFKIGGNFQRDNVDTEDATLLSDGTSLGEFTDDAGINTFRTYLYTTISPFASLDIDLGYSYTESDFDEVIGLDGLFVPAVESEDQHNPKGGFNFYLTPSTTVRGAWLKTLNRVSSGDIFNLEPAFVGGFNQVYDDFSGASQEFAGIGIDQKFAKWTYIGGDYSERSIDRARLDFETGERVPLDLKEERLRAYWYQILSKLFSSTVEYTFSEADDDTVDKQFDTHQIVGQLNFFDRSGFFAFLRTGWYQQRFQDLFTDLDAIAGSDTDNLRDFWLTDASLGYEFDKQQGSLQVTFRNIFDREFDYQGQTADLAILPNFSVIFSGSYNF